jgi:outer membrane receptor for ferrienterochelin and colicin
LLPASAPRAQHVPVRHGVLPLLDIVRSRMRGVFSLCVIFATFAYPLGVSAQESAAPALSGVVSSERGPVTSAAVKIVGPITRTYTTAPDGAFHFDSLPEGTYRLTVSAQGFEPPPPEAVTIVAGTPQTLTVSLSAATLNSLRTIGSVTAKGRGTVTINHSGAAESTLSSDDFIARGDAQVQNELEELPGVELTRASSGGAPGANTDIAIRGGSTYETQTLIDGHPVTGGRFGTYLVQFLNPLVLGDVEIDKGPGVLGNTIANAIGGTANFRTPSITSTLTGRATAGYDSFNGSTYSARISDTILNGKLGFLAAYGFNGTPGYFTGNILSVDANDVNSKLGAAPPLATVITSIPASETYQNRSEVFKLAFNFSPTTSLTLGSIGEQTYVDYTATLDTVEPFTIAPCIGEATTTPQTCAGASDYTNPAYGGLVGQTVLASSTGDNLYLGNFEIDNEPIFTADLRTKFGPGSFLGRFYTGAISRNIDDPEEAQQLTSCPQPSCSSPTFDSPFYQAEVDHLHGVDAEYSLPIGRTGQDLAQASYDQHGDQALYCSGSSAEFALSKCSINNLLLTSRTYSIRGFAKVAPNVQAAFGNYFSDTTFVGSRYDPRATLVWTPQPKTAIRFAVGTAYVAPPVDFVAPVPGDTKAVVNNTLYVSDALKPETSAGVNLGADFGIRNDSKFTIDLYRTALTNRFETITIKPGASLPSYDPFGFYNGTPFKSIDETYNASDATEEGIELTYVRKPKVGIGGNAELDLSRAFNYNTAIPSFGTAASATGSQTGTIGGDGNELPGYQIPGFPYSHGRAQLTYREPNTNLYGFGATIYGANNSFGEPGFTVFDANMNLALKHGLRLNVSLSNIFDHDDNRTLGEYAYGYLPPGETTPYSLFFYPPRRLNLQLEYPFGDR